MNQDEIIQFEQWREAFRELLLVKELITAAEISRIT